MLLSLGDNQIVLFLNAVAGIAQSQFRPQRVTGNVFAVFFEIPYQITDAMILTEKVRIPIL